MDEAEGVPYHYQKQHHEVVRINPDGSETEQRVPALMYIDVERKDEGEIMPDYVVWSVLPRTSHLMISWPQLMK